MDPLAYFWLFLRASLLSTGGMGNLPILHQDMLQRGWATDRQFAEALAVGQVSPGPNGLWAVSLGYLTAGWLGAALSVLAISLPPLLVLVVDRLHRALSHRPEVHGAMRGLSLSVIGVSSVVLVDLLRAQGIDAGTLGIVLLSVVLALRRVPVVVVLLTAALVGMVMYH